MYGKGYCTNHHIHYDTLYAYVLSRLQYWSKQAHTDEEKLLKKLLNAGDREFGAIRKKQLSSFKENFVNTTYKLKLTIIFRYN